MGRHDAAWCEKPHFRTRLFEHQIFTLKFFYPTNTLRIYSPAYPSVPVLRHSNIRSTERQLSKSLSNTFETYTICLPKLVRKSTFPSKPHPKGWAEYITQDFLSISHPRNLKKSAESTQTVNSALSQLSQPAASSNRIQVSSCGGGGTRLLYTIRPAGRPSSQC